MSELTNLSELVERLALRGEPPKGTPQNLLHHWATQLETPKDTTPTGLSEQRSLISEQFQDIPYGKLAKAIADNESWTELQDKLSSYQKQNRAEDTAEGTPNNPFDIIHVGGGPAAANFFIPLTTPRQNAKEYTGAVIDENPHPGYQWQGRTWIKLNNTTRKTQLFGPNNFGATNDEDAAGNTFPLGLPTGLQLPEVTMKRYACGELVGRLVELNTTAGADYFAQNKEVIGVVEDDRAGSSKVITPENRFFANTVILSGNQEPRTNPSSPERDVGAYNLPQLRETIRDGSLLKEVREELKGRGENRDPNILVVGDGDSAKTVIEYLTGRAPDSAYGPKARKYDVVRDQKSIVWAGQDAMTCAEYQEQARTRYTHIGSSLPRSELEESVVVPVPGRVKDRQVTSRDGENTYVVTQATSTKPGPQIPFAESSLGSITYEPDITIWCDGVKPDPIDGWQAQAAPDPIRDRFGFPIAFPAVKESGETAQSVFMHGQGTNRSVETLGEAVKETYQDIGIEANNQALAFWGYSIMRHGFAQYQRFIRDDEAPPSYLGPNQTPSSPFSR